MNFIVRIYQTFIQSSNGLAGTRTQGLRLAKAAIFQLIYEPFVVVSYGPRICYQSPKLIPGSFDVTVFRFPINRLLAPYFKYGDFIAHVCVLLRR